jgi:ketosteroid isomerase-like protein
MRSFVRIALVVAVAMTAAGCQGLMDTYNTPPPPQQIAYGPATEKQLQRALSRYSALMVQMDATAISEMYAPDGVWERQSGPLRGRDAIRAALIATNGVRVVSNEMIMANMSFMGPSVVQVGDFRQSSRLPDGKVVTASGRFEATWVRGPNGEWWIRRMVFLPAK